MKPFPRKRKENEGEIQQKIAATQNRFLPGLTEKPKIYSSHRLSKKI
tara:strand:+ start:419 stop:559 length:141 start_codon:yes stop_codon:yes gene_type:complete